MLGESNYLAGTIPRMRLRDFRMQAIAPYGGVSRLEKVSKRNL